MSASGSNTPPNAQTHRHTDASAQLPEGPCRQCAFSNDPTAATSVESPKLTSASLVINLWLTYAQAAALIAIAVAAVVALHLWKHNNLLSILRFSPW